jgi:hypothetical protein
MACASALSEPILSPTGTHNPDGGDTLALFNKLGLLGQQSSSIVYEMVTDVGSPQRDTILLFWTCCIWVTGSFPCLELLFWPQIVPWPIAPLYTHAYIGFCSSVDRPDTCWHVVMGRYQRWSCFFCSSAQNSVDSRVLSAGQVHVMVYS